MLQNRGAQRVLFVISLVAVLGLSGCRRQETTPPPTSTPPPAAVEQSQPAVSTQVSPLPTPGADNSPVKP